MIYERTTSPASAVSTDDLKAHMRVEHDDEDVDIASMGFTASMSVEDFAAIALLTTTIRARVDCWSDLTAPLTLPIGPVLDDATITVEAIKSGVTTTANASAFWLETGTRPRLHVIDTALLPDDFATSIIRLTYDAGYGEAGDVPADLAHAVKEQALHLYDLRAGEEWKRGTPAMAPHAARLAQRYKRVAL